MATAAAATSASSLSSPPTMVVLTMLLWLSPSPAQGCHTTQIIKQLGSPYSARDDDIIADMVDAKVPEKCEDATEEGPGQWKSAHM